MKLLLLALALAASAPLSPANATQLALANTAPLAHASMASPTNAGAPLHRYFGFLQGKRGTTLVLRLRTGRLVVVDASAAFAATHVSASFYAGKPTVIVGRFAANGVFAATIVKRAAPNPTNWDIDR